MYFRFHKEISAALIILFLLVVYHTYLQAKKNKNDKERITNYKLLKKVWLDLV